MKTKNENRRSNSVCQCFMMIEDEKRKWQLQFCCTKAWGKKTNKKTKKKNRSSNFVFRVVGGWKIKMEVQIPFSDGVGGW